MGLPNYSPEISAADLAYVAGIDEMVGVMAVTPDLHYWNAMEKVGLFACTDGVCGNVCSHAYSALHDRFGRGPLGGDDSTTPAYAFEDGAKDAWEIYANQGATV